MIHPSGIISFFSLSVPVFLTATLFHHLYSRLHQYDLKPFHILTATVLQITVIDHSFI